MYTHILVPTDGSDLTLKAVDTAIGLAQRLGAKLSTLSVKEPFPYTAVEIQPVAPQAFFEAQERLAQSRVKAVVERARAQGLACAAATQEAYHPWEAIHEHAQDIGADLIVMASHGRRGVSALILGSETQKLLTHSKLPVLVVR